MGAAKSPLARTSAQAADTGLHNPGGAAGEKRSANAGLAATSSNNGFVSAFTDRNWLTGDGSLTDSGAIAHDVWYPLLDMPEGAGFKLVGGGLMAVRLGKMGEDAVRATYNIGGKGFLS